MIDRPLDEWRDRMVAALYGELDDAGRRELEARIEQDQALRADWQELHQARAALRLLAQEADGEDAEIRSSARPPGRRAGRVVSFPRVWLASAAGFAAAALLFIGLLLAGLRVDRTPAGVLVGFGEPRIGGMATAVDGGAASAMGSILASERQHLTRAELAAVAELLMNATAARIDDLERRQTSSQVELTRSLYDALAVRQQRQYDDLATQIQLAAYRLASANRYDRAEPGQRQLTPVEEDPNDGTD
jgi:anti-sigma factor RsiW